MTMRRQILAGAVACLALLACGSLTMSARAVDEQSAPGAATAKPDAIAKPAATAKVLRAGMIGLDTSHCPAFTELINNPKATGPLAELEVVAAFPGGSPDIHKSIDRVPGYTKELRDHGVEIVDSIDALLGKVDVVLIESVDGRPHFEQAKPVILAGKPLYIDKPLAGSLADAIAIFRLAEQHHVPIFTSSSLRFSPGPAGWNSGKIGDVLGCVTWGHCELEPHHPDLFWYGVHGVELVYSVMGPGCTHVVRTHAEDADIVTGVWKDGRTATFRGLRGGKSEFGGMVFGKKGNSPIAAYVGYGPLVEEIGKFFQTKRPPVSAAESIEIFTFMEAADESKRQAGAPVALADVYKKASAAADKKLQP
jgi:hypothetical protein